MNLHERAVEIEDLLNHYLRNGEASLSNAAIDLGISHTVLMRVARRMQGRGELQTRNHISPYGRPELWWSVVRTRKAA